MLRITFGLHLDGARAWSAGDRLGAPTLGPAGFLTLLEAQLGLGRDWPTHADRVVQYRDCLRRCDAPGRFFHDTFALDELGTAATLLRWRDRWGLHGWDGKFDGQVAPRLRDMSDVEALARGSVSPGEGERLQAVLDILGSRRVPIDEIVLADPIDAFPADWQRLLARFPVRSATQLTQPQARGMLGDLQGAVLAVQRGEPVKPVDWRGDGTLRVFQAGTRMVGARWLAERLRATQADTLLIAGAHALLLDETLVAADLPRQGFRDTSTLRPSLQLLPIVLALLWEPLDFGALLAFLTHPICPIPAHARWRLARSLANRPGIGGEGWQADLRHIEALDPERAPRVRAAIVEWLEHQRYADRRAPVCAVIARARALAAFFQERLGEEDAVLRAAYIAGLAQASGFADGVEQLARQGVEQLSRPQVEQLVAQVAAGGRANALLEPEVGCLRATEDPAAAIEPCDTVLWWQLADPGAVRHDPWSRRELDDLARCGVALPSMAQRLAHAAETWTRPVRAARAHLELVLPPDGTAVHPVWLLLKALVRDIPVQRLDDVLSAGSAASAIAEHAPLAQAVTPVPHRPLPERRRWWQLPATVPLRRDQPDSYTSLNLLLNDPHQWALRYAAQLRPSDVLTVSDWYRLFGNLAHRLVERAYKDAGALTMSEAALQGWLDTAIPAVLAEEGAVLLMPGRRADQERFRAAMQMTFRALREQLAAAKVTQVRPEMALEGAYEGGTIRGSADLVLTGPDGKLAILDMKSSGSRKGYPDLLANDGHLQLVLYAELLRQREKSQVHPALAYFLLSSGRLVARSDTYFPAAQVVDAKREEETTAQLWQRFLVSWRWRMAQIASGRVEVVAEDIPPTDESAAPDDGLAVQEQNSRYNDFAHLAGWDARA
jgi:hypothetical protein